jgi:hypothetical protein
VGNAKGAALPHVGQERRRPVYLSGASTAHQAPPEAAIPLTLTDPSAACVTAVDRRGDHARLGGRLAARPPIGRQAKSFFLVSVRWMFFLANN